MKVFIYLLLFTLLTACGGAPGAPGRAPEASNPAGITLPRPAPASAPKEKLPDEIVPTGVGDELSDEPGDFTGPMQAPVYTPTRYQEYIRRSVTPAPALPTPRNECFTAAEVRNYDGLDGCGIVLETDEGNLFVVGAVPRGDPLEPGTRISFGYEYMTDFADNACTDADAIIRITCKRLLRVSSGIPQPIVCESYDTPSQWLIDLAKNTGATYITRFPWADERFVYLLETPEGQYMYDCRGYLICKPRRNCLGFIDDFSAGQLIWEG